MTVNQLTRPRVALIEGRTGNRAPIELVRSRLGELNFAIYNDLSFAHAEAAIEEAADLLDMQNCWWTPDAASPYDCEPARQFSCSRGWPKELMDTWRKNRISLYSPFHIRSRFENLPFVSEPDLRNRPHACAGYVKANQMLCELGIRSMLHVPVHLGGRSRSLRNACYSPAHLGRIARPGQSVHAQFRRRARIGRNGE
jgi:hypothetical protein